MKKLLYAFLAAGSIAAGCQRNDVPETKPVPDNDRIFGTQIPENERIPGVLNVLFQEETVQKLEQITEPDGNVRLDQTRSFRSDGIIRMRRLFPEAGRFEDRTRREGLHRWYVVEYDPTVSLTRAADGWVRFPGAELIEYVPKIRIDVDSEPTIVNEFTPSRMTAGSSLPFDDPRLFQQWHYQNRGDGISTVSGCDINVFPVWKRYTTGSPEVIVGVVDGGIDFKHEDLADNMWHNPEKSGNAAYGYNFVNDSFQVNPDNHGTHVAGTIAAVNNNGKGVCGIAGGNAAQGQKGVSLMSCQIFDGEREGNGATAIKWSADHGAVISQNSWGYTTETTTPKSLKSAVDYFIKYAGIDENGVQTGPMKGGIVIFAAGNENKNVSSADYEQILSVASVGADFRRAYYSNYGAWVDIAAPGGDVKKGNQVMSTLPNNKYGLYQGTSMACPHVSGVAALIISQYGGEGFTPDELWQRLTESATSLVSFNKSFLMGAGLVNAYRAIAGSGGIPPETPSNLTADTKSNNIHFSVRIPRDEDDGVPTSIMVYYNTEPFNVISEELMFAQFYLDEDSHSEDILAGTISGLDFNQSYYIAAAASDLAGNKSGLTDRITVTTGSNTPPVIEVLGETQLTLKPHQTGSLEFKVHDEDGHFYLIDLQKEAEGIVLDTLVRDMPKIVASGPELASGRYAATLVVTDTYGAAVRQSVSITVQENHEPYIVNQFEDRIFNARNTTEELRCDHYFKDDDGEDLNYTVSIDNTSVVNLTSQDGIFYLTPMNYGYATVTVTATDVRGKQVSQQFQVLVRDGEREIDVYPNPVREKLYVRTSSEQQASVCIISAAGATFYQGESAITPFEPTVIDMTKAAPGPYTILLTINGKSLKYNLVKL